MPIQVIEADPVYSAIFHSSAEVLIVVSVGGDIVLANEACERVLGHAPASIVGKPVETLVPARFSTHGELRARFSAEPRPRAMGGGLLLAALHADGSEIPVEIGLTPIEVDHESFTVCTLRDMRGRLSLPETLRIQATALRSAANGIVITDRTGTIVWVNPAACAITGYSSGDLVGRHTRILKSGEHDQAFYADIWTTICSGRTWSGTIVNRRRDGTLYHEEQTIAPVLDESGTVTHFIAIKQDVTRRRMAEEALAAVNEELAEKVRQIEALNARLEEKAIRDPLTGLHNRRFFEEIAEREVARGRRLGEPLSVLLIDIDHFKAINDAYGHDSGDKALQCVAKLIRLSARASDLVCRYGGEEFVCVLAGVPEQAALRVADEWRRAVEIAEIVTEGGETLRCTVSIGVAVLPPGRETMASAVRRADAALYEAKRAGRNRVAAAPAL